MSILDDYNNNSRLSIIEVMKKNKREKKKIKLYSSITRRLTHYHLYFDTSNKWNNNALFENPLLRKNNTYSKSNSIINNLLINNMIICLNKNYELRVLSKDQITWKNISSNKKKQKNNNNNKNETTITNEIIDNNNKNSTEPEINKIDESKEKVHKFLIFTFLLPNHPFSHELYNSLVIAAPMFPNVTVVVGIIITIATNYN
jgi:hypothetical protein